MKFEEALQAMRNGKKVHVKTGNPDIDRWALSIVTNCDGKQIMLLGINEDIWKCPTVLSTDSILSHEWEIVENE